MKRLIGILLILLFMTACVSPEYAQTQPEAVIADPTEEPAEEPTEAPADEPAEEPVEEPTAEPAGDTEEITFSLTTLQGDAIDENYFYEHKLTMVNYWATWCGPCVGEIPDLSDIALSYEDKGFAILGVLIWDDDIDGAKAFLTQQSVSYPSVVAEGFFADQAQDYYGIPMTFFVDGSGHIVTEPIVGSMSGAEWRATIDDLLAKVG